MSAELCVEWRQRGKTSWNYATGTRGKSRGELERLLNGWRDRNAAFEFRIQLYTISREERVTCCAH